MPGVGLVTTRGEIVPIQPDSLQVLGRVLDTATGTIGASATQLFASGDPRANIVRIVKTAGGGADPIYVGYDSGTSATKWAHRLLNIGDFVEIPREHALPIYIFGTAATPTYAAYLLEVQRRALT